MAILKFKDENNQWQDLAALRGRDGVIQYQAGNGIVIDGNVISAIQQDLSNYYTKSQVNDLIDAIDKVSLEAVNELPATGEPNVIYLVPSANPQTTNAKDEYIYINNAWEQIGTTAVDLSNYYTKSEVDNKVITTLTENTTLTRYGVYKVATDINKGIRVTGITTGSYYTIPLYGEGVLIYAGNKDYSQTAWRDVFFYFCTAWNEPMIYYWNDSTRKEFQLSNYLAKNNTTSYTPSGDYNPATKKYVDDAVAGAGGGIDPAELLKRGIYVRCDSQLNTSSTTSLSAAAIAELQAGLQAAYDAGLSTVDITLAFKTNNSSTLGYMTYQVYGLRLHSSVHIIGKPTSMHYLDFNSDTTTYADAAPIRKFELVISATWSGDTITVTAAQYRLVQKNLLFSDNVYAYTPTGNYNPATKKYVDDSIASAIPTGLEQRVIYIDISSTYTGVLSGDHTYQNITIPAEALAELNALDDISNALIIIHTAYDHVLLNPQSKGTLIDSSVTPKVYGNTYVGTAIRYGSVVPSSPTYTQCCLVIRYTKDPFTLTGTCDFRSKPQEIALKSELHTHSNKTILDTITAGNVSDWNDAVTNGHTHANKTVLDGISSSDITNWNKTHIYSGTSTPGAGTGENGDIYVKYTA